MEHQRESLQKLEQGEILPRVLNRHKRRVLSRVSLDLRRGVFLAGLNLPNLLLLERAFQINLTTIMAQLQMILPQRNSPKELLNKT